MMVSNQWRKLHILWPGVTSPKQGLGLCSSVFHISISVLVSFETLHPLIHIDGCVAGLCGAAWQQV